MNIDWSKAPEDATHYFPTIRSDNFWKEVSGGFVSHNGESWGDSVCNLSEVSDLLIPRPTEPQWEDGLPPVGEVCEVWHDCDWVECLYLGVDTYGNYAYQMSKGDYRGEFYVTSDIGNFRPLKTQEEVEREKLIELLAGTLGDICPLPEVVNAVIDAGWRPTK